MRNSQLYAEGWKKMEFFFLFLCWAHQCRKHNVRDKLLGCIYTESKITMIKWSPERQRDRHVFMMKAKTGMKCHNYLQAAEQGGFVKGVTKLVCQ